MLPRLIHLKLVLPSPFLPEKTVPKLPRVVVPGYPHHITQRGNRRASIFNEPNDRKVYLDLLGRYAERYCLHIWAYALMTNHVHLVAVPEQEPSLSATIRDAHSGYATYFNRTYPFVGHLWQCRFYSCVLDSGHLRSAVRYVERNPVRAGLVRRAEEYEWSSAAAHCGLRKDPLLSDAFPSEDWPCPQDCSRWLEDEESEEERTRIRQRTFTGHPSGSRTFVKDLEHLLGRPLSPQKPGPKPKLKMKKL